MAVGYRQPKAGSKLYEHSQNALAAIQAAGKKGVTYKEIAELIGVSTTYGSPLIGSAFNQVWEGWDKVARTDDKPVKYIWVAKGTGRKATMPVPLSSPRQQRTQKAASKNGHSIKGWQFVGDLKGAPLLSDGKGKIYVARPLTEVMA